MALYVHAAGEQELRQAFELASKARMPVGWPTARQLLIGTAAAAVTYGLGLLVGATLA